jgi:hypothetical protein
MSDNKLRITEVPPEAPPIPPLRPSAEPDLACVHKYQATWDNRIESIAGRRGTEFHRFMKAYVERLVATDLSHDESWWRAELDVTTCGRDTRDLLDGYLPNFKIDPQKVLHVEQRLYLDDEMQPTEDPKRAALSGQPDIIMIDGKTAKVPDYKSQFRIVDAKESFQGKGYALIVLQHLPFIEEVEFELAFIRWGGSKRTVTYTRKDHLRHLIGAAHKVRVRQLDLHVQMESGNLEPAVSGPHCLGCPLRLMGCPIAKVNPYAQQTAEDLIRFVVWAEGATKQAREVLKDLFLHEKAAPIADGNGRTYEPAFIHRQKRKIPLAALDTVRTWEAEGNEKRSSLLESLRLGGLTQKLKAKFRLPLAEKLDAEGMIQVTDYTVFGIKISGIEQSEDERDFEE